MLKNSPIKNKSNIHSLYEKLSIENWILPACFLGVIDTIVWVAAPWSQQIPEGQYDFLIGKPCTTTHNVCCVLMTYFSTYGIYDAS